MTRLNVKLIVILVISLVVLTTGVVVVHGIQMNSSVDSLLKRAEKAKEENPQTALRLYQLYRNYKPDDTEHYADFATFAAEVALKPGASGRDIGIALRELEQILRGNVPPEREPELRRKLIELDMNVGRFGDAKEHLLALKKRNEGGADIDLKLARCQALTGHYQEAADLLYAQIGYNSKSKSFDVEKATAPKELGAYSMLAQILRDRLTDSQMTDRKEVANRVIEQMIVANPESAKAYLTQAQFAQGTDVAKSAIATAMKLAPDDPDVLAQAIEVALIGKNFDQAEELIAKATKLQPKDERFYRYSVLAADMQKKTADGTERLTAALKALPDSPALLGMQFERQLQTNDLDGARVTLKQLSVAKIAPAIRAFLEAKLLVAQGDHQAASQKLAALRPQLAKIPELVKQTDMLLMQCYNALGQRDRVNNLLERMPGTMAAEVVRADGLAKNGKIREALEIYEALAKTLEQQNQLATVPQVASAVMQLRIAQQMARPKDDRNWQDVDTWFDKMRDLNLLKPPADSMVEAELLIRKGENDRAAQLLQDLQKKNPNDSSIAGMYAGMLIQDGKRDEVSKYIASLSPELRSSPALIGARIESEFVAGRATDEVKSSLTKISGEVDKLPVDVQARAHTALGVAYLRLNDLASAELEWKKAAELQPKDGKIRWLMFDLARQSANVPALEALQTWFVKEFGADDAQSKLAEAAIIVVKVREGLKAKYGNQPDQLALSDEDQQNLTKARDILREVNTARPGWEEQPRLMAEINVLESRHDDAIANLQDVISSGQASAQTVKQLVMLLHLRQRYADAHDLMDKYASLLGGEDMKRLRTEIDLHLGDVGKALQNIDAQYDKNSQDPAVHLYAGRLFSTAGKGEQAEAAFRKAVEFGPAVSEAWLALITQLAMNKKGEEALKTVQEAQIKLPEDARNGVLAQGYEVVGDQAQAEHYYLAALEAAPNDLAVQRSVASYYLRANRREDAEKQLEKLMNAKTESTTDRDNVGWARRATAQLWASDGNYQKFSKALELLNPQGRKPTADDISARVALLLDRTDATSSRQALRSLEDLKQLRPLNIQERIAVARLNERLGDWFKARDEMNSILASSNADTAARLSYAEMLLRRGEIDDAESQLRAIKQVEAQYAPQMALLAAKILSARGRAADAGAMLTNLLPKERPLPSAQVPLLSAIAAALEDVKQYEQAEKFLREYVTYEPGQMLRLAEFLARRGKVDAALDLADQYRRAFPTVQILGVGLAALHQNVTPPTAPQIERIEQWIQLAQREEDSYQVQLAMADLRDFQRNYTETEKVYRSILNRSGVPAQNRAEVMNNLAFLLAMQGRDVDEALKLINDAVAIYGPQTDMLDTRGVVNLIKGDLKQAVADLSDAVIATDPKPIKFVHLAMAQAAANDLPGARKSLEKAKSLKFSRDDLSPLEKSKFEELLKQLNMTV